ncbi:MAG: hypothetical protein JWO36_6628 [Myxococcales bacterium]|nr:hypothetical protein [Myxococcales bacterium]
MLRAILLGVLSVSVGGCKSQSDSAKVEPGAAAGKVIEVTGTVTAYLTSEARAAGRTLHAGDTIAGSETIDTGAEGRITIELAHNLVRVDLPPNTQKKLTETIGWDAPRKNENAKAADQDTSAAGRPAERAAAESTATAAPGAIAPAMGSVEPAKAEPPPVVRSSPPPKPERMDDMKKSAAPKLDRRPEAMPSHAAKGSDKPLPPKAVMPRGAIDDVRRAPQAQADVSQVQAAAPQRDVSDPAAEAKRLLASHHAALVGCLDPGTTIASLQLHIDESGKVTLGPSKLSATALQCVQGVLRGIAFAHVKIDLPLEIKK